MCGRPDNQKLFLPFPLLFILEMSLFPEYFLYHCHFLLSLYGEYVVRFFLPDGVFSRSALFS